MIKLLTSVFALICSLVWGANDIVYHTFKPNDNAITWVSGGGNNLVAQFSVFPPDNSVWALLFTDGDARDYSTNVFNATASGGVSFGSGYCTLDGIDGYLYLDDNPMFEFTSGNFTAAGWVRFNVFPGDGIYPSIIGKLDDYVGWGIFKNDGGALTFRLWDGGWDFSYPYTTTAEWLHVAMVLDDTNCIAYVNGTNVYNAAATNPGATANPTIVGQHYGGSGNYGFLDGDVDDIILVNTALSSNQVYLLYQHGKDEGK